MSIPYDEGLHLDQPWLAVRWDADHRCVLSEFRAVANSAEFRADHRAAGARPARHPDVCVITEALGWLMPA
jgi:hypothetical protein